MSPQISPLGTGYPTWQELAARSEVPVRSPSPERTPGTAEKLNSMSESILNQLGTWGAALEGHGFGRPANESVVMTSKEQLLVPYESTALADTILRKSAKGFHEGVDIQNKLQRSLGNYHLVVDNSKPSSLGFQAAGPFARAVTGVVDSVTGVGNVLVAIHRDQEQGDSSYRGTLKESLLSTFQISAGGLAGVAAGAAAGAIGLGAGTLAAPVIVGVGVGLVASYAAGAISDYVRSLW